MSSVLTVALGFAGVVTVALGLWHLGVPRWFAFRPAIGLDGGDAEPIGEIRLGRWTYRRRRADVIGLSWIMSNAASYVLLSIGVLDLLWAAGRMDVPLTLGAAWIAGWWVLRAAGQSLVGHRRVDLAFAGVFALLAGIHLVVAVAGP